MNRIIYQIFLRAFTEEGTLKAAEKHLRHVAELGVSSVYLAAFCKADGSENREYWSERQKASEMNNPKNPYRIADYFKIDEEYGTHEDFKSFVKAAHREGLEVIVDLVYLHCGPEAVFIKENPDFVQRDEEGKIRYNEYHFPLINFESKKLRQYLIENMRFWIEEFDIDGYRCDVGDEVPLDFWREATAEIKKLKPQFLMINEGRNPEYVREVFDINYNFEWNYALCDTVNGAAAAKEIVRQDIENRAGYAGIRMSCFRGIDNHDIANDAYDRRIDRTKPREAAEAAFVVNFLINGTPFLYNGNEIADGARHSIWSNRFFGGCHLDWDKALTADGKAREAFLKNLISYRKQNPELENGRVRWTENTASDQLLTFERYLSDKKLFVAVNLSDSEICAAADVEIPVSAVEAFGRDASYKVAGTVTELKLGKWGFLILEDSRV